jgi:alpha-galactosidase
VYAADRSEALVAYVQLDSAETSVVAPLRLPGLDETRRYRVERIRLPGEPPPMAHDEPAWCRSPVHLTGAQLAAHGLQPPSLLPQTALLVHLGAGTG